MSGARVRQTKLREARSRRRGLRLLEWTFLLVGLLAVDCYVWVNTSSVLYQAYQNWAFEQTLQGLKPSIGGFIKDESEVLVGQGRNGQSAESRKAVPTNPPGGVAIAPVEPRSVVGRLAIPRLDIAVMVREGADEGTLARAVGHIPGTALPGNIGNVALAGHRDSFFRPLRNIRKNDIIELETTAGVYKYAVKSTQIVTPHDVSVLNASGGETLTLVTCYPFYYVGSAPKRFIVHAVKVGPSPVRQEPNS